MQNDVSNLSDTIVPKSDQLNADQLLGGPITITVTNVERGTADQPVVVYYAGDSGRPYKPCKSMRKVLIFAWGDDGHAWIGRSMTLYNNPDVMFGGVKVGGIRISHLSHIDRDISISLTATKGKKNQYTIHKLQVRQSPADIARANVRAAADQGSNALRAAWQGLTKQIRAELGEEFLNLCKATAANVDQQSQAQESAAQPEAAPAVQAAQQSVSQDEFHQNLAANKAEKKQQAADGPVPDVPPPADDDDF